MFTNRTLQAASAILHKANHIPSKALFFKECLEILVDLFDCTVAVAWFSSGGFYRHFKMSTKSSANPHCPDHSPQDISSHIPNAANFPESLINMIRSTSPAPDSSLKWRNGICWTGDADKVLSEKRFLEAGLSYIADAVGKDQSSLMLSVFDTKSDGLGIVILSVDGINYFTPPQISAFARISAIFENAFFNWHTNLVLQERVKELNCMYRMARIDETAKKSLEEVLLEIIEIVPSAWLYPEDAYVRIKLDEHFFQKSDFPENQPKLVADIVLNGLRHGKIEVAYRQEHPSLDEGPFLLEERKLLDTLARELALIIDRKLFEKEKMEIIDRLKHADRLNMIGQLSAAVAHEINEPLTALLGYAQLAAKCPGLPHQAQTDIDKIISTSLHAREIVRKLLMFARKMPSRIGDVDANDILKESLHFFEARCEKEKIAVELRLSQNLPAIRGDLGQLRQVFSNLMLNAIQAMPAGGQLHIETREDGKEILVTVQDNGCGMKREVMEKIFIPFFTTKPHYQGTGLGLPVVQEIVAAHGGTVNVQSEPGSGTRFDLRFPFMGPL
ncbi:MAG: GHKL domain-containing protein [Deltaproteobacteria bacterium]|nr:GHKL domain-containing protein [Deltaproteobacteria bacterium]